MIVLYTMMSLPNRVSTYFPSSENVFMLNGRIVVCVISSELVALTLYSYVMSNFCDQVILDGISYFMGQQEHIQYIICKGGCGIH
jgi:hypothetical protein